MDGRRGHPVTDLFVSYKAEDRGRLKPLVAALEAEGFHVWWDAHIGGGTDWREEIQRHLDGARCVIVAWSKRSVGAEGRFVRDEASSAQQAGSYVPIKIDAVKPPLGFGETQALDFIGWKGKRSDPRFLALVDAVKAHLTGDASVVRPAALAQPKVSRRTVMAGGVGALAVAGVGGWVLLKPGASAASNRIAVMSFANMSGDAGQAYFSEGIAEELRGALSRIGMQVIGRASSDAVKDLNTQVAAAKLGVANILTGSVRRSPETIRVSAQLLDGIEGVERWSQTYNRASGDALEIQTNIANMVAEALSLRFSGDEQNRRTQGGTNNPAAQDLLLKARSLVSQDDSEASLQRAIGIIDAALALDRDYGDAWSDKAVMLWLQAGQHAKSAAESQSYYVIAARTAKRAIQLAPRSTRSQSALAKILDSQLNRRAAQAQWDRVRTLPGIDGIALASYAMFLSESGQGARAVPVADQALALDPLNPIPFFLKAMILGHSRRYSEAVQAVNRAAELGPNLNIPRVLHAYFQMMLGNTAQAREEFASIKGDHGQAMAWESVAAARQGDMVESNRILGRLRTVHGDAVYYQIAQVLAQQAKKDEAIEALEKAAAARDPGLGSLLVDPLLDPLRADRRFQELVKELGFRTQ